MKVSVCLVCLKTSEDDPTSDWRCGPPLLNKFFKFSENYLKISAVTTKELLRSLSDDENGGELTFCEKCELSVITPICQVYLQLLSTRLRLSWELEQLAKLLKNSDFISDSLTDEIGVNNISQLEGFRKLLTANCQLKRREVMPSVLAKRLIMTPRLLEFGLHEEVLDNLAGVLESGSDCSEEVPSTSLKTEMELYDDQDDDADEDGDAFDPLSLDGFDSLDLPCNNGDDETGLVGSVETTTNADSIDGHEIEANVIKLEFHRSPNTQPLFENEDNEGTRDNEEFMFLSDPPSNPDPNQPQSGLFKQKCQSCVKVFDTEHGLQAHYDYHHQRYTCAPCGKIYAGKKYFQKHINSSHQQQDIIASNERVSFGLRLHTLVILKPLSEEQTPTIVNFK
ncbi:Sal-like protein 4 [Orchesella cincta]|uniref:Sal-like protein 4 n=1 Tax=Orchesella cincta TaxID=48709 RepID=A0A1D2M8V1_ORCCI|nr:Sal-like protein 4 [Orchesella cincta]